MNVFNLFAKLTLDTSEFDKQVDDAASSFDELGDAAGDVPGDAQKAEKAVDDFAQSVEEMNTEADQATSTLNDAEQALHGVESKAKETAPEIDRTSDSADGLGDKLKDVGGGSSDAAGALSELEGKLKGVLTAAGMIGTAVAAITELTSAVMEMDEVTEDYRVSTGKLKTAFKTVGYSTKTATKTFKEMYAVLGDTDTAVEASQLLVQLTSNTEEMATWTEIAAGVCGTFGDSLPINSLIEAANETAKVGQVTGVLADALNWVGISEDDFNLKLAQCTDTAERTALISETLAGKYADAAQAFQDTNATIIDSRESFIELQEVQADLGDSVSRLKTQWQELTADETTSWAKTFSNVINYLADQIEKTNVGKARRENVLYGQSVEEATASLAEWQKEYDELEATIDAGDATTRDINRWAELGYKIESGTAELNEMCEAEEKVSAEAKNAAEAVDTLTVSANGFSVELSGSNMTLEEATERLTTYTDAATNMFSQINTESELSYSDMLGNLQHNIDATNAFADNMASIAGELPAEMAEMFYSGGAEMYAGVVAMLAEANAGSDEGLAQLRALWEEGGAAAIAAFAQSVGAGGTDITGELSAKLDSDTSTEEAGKNLVTRTSDAIISAVSSAGFNTAGSNAIVRFISGMNSKRQDAITAAGAIASAAAGAMGSGGSTGSGRAGGLDYVPYDGYPAILHRGESVLTKAEASDWRRGNDGNSAGITIVQNIQSVPQTPVELASATAAYFETARWAI